MLHISDISLVPPVESQFMGHMAIAIKRHTVAAMCSESPLDTWDRCMFLPKSENKINKRTC